MRPFAEPCYFVTVWDVFSCVRVHSVVLDELHKSCNRRTVRVPVERRPQRQQPRRGDAVRPRTAGIRLQKEKRRRVADVGGQHPPGAMVPHGRHVVTEGRPVTLHQRKSGQQHRDCDERPTGSSQFNAVQRLHHRKGERRLFVGDGRRTFDARGRIQLLVDAQKRQRY